MIPSIFLVFSFFLSNTCFAQTQNVERDKYPAGRLSRECHGSAEYCITAVNSDGTAGEEMPLIPAAAEARAEVNLFLARYGDHFYIFAIGHYGNTELSEFIFEEVVPSAPPDPDYCKKQPTHMCHSPKG